MTEQKKKEVGRREERKKERGARKEGREEYGLGNVAKGCYSKFSMVLFYLPVLREIRYGHSVLVPLLSLVPRDISRLTRSIESPI